MGWPKGKPRGKKVKAEPVKRFTERRDDGREWLMTEFGDVTDAIGAKDRPYGPYTVWSYERRASGEGWTYRDFDTLQDAIDWPEKGNRYVITKPVKYRVEEIGETRAVTRKFKDVPQPGIEDAGPPVDPDKPDTGNARYV